MGPLSGIQAQAPTPSGISCNVPDDASTAGDSSVPEYMTTNVTNTSSNCCRLHATRIPTQTIISHDTTGNDSVIS